MTKQKIFNFLGILPCRYKFNVLYYYLLLVQETRRKSLEKPLAICSSPDKLSKLRPVDYELLPPTNGTLNANQKIPQACSYYPRNILKIT